MKNDTNLSNVPHENENSSTKITTKPKTANFKHTLEVMIIFVTGMIVSACLLVGAYYITINKDLYVTRQSAITTAELSNTQHGKESVSESDLDKYVDMKDCSLDPSFSNILVLSTRVTMKSIDLDSGTITSGNASNSGEVRWSELPIVVDSQCKPIKITDLKSGDILNLYTSSTKTDIYTNLRVIQKAV